MSISEATYLDLASGEYQNSEYAVGDKLGSKTQTPVLTSTAEDPKKYENNGLQGSIVKVKGQTVVVFRGSQSMGTTEGNKDWLTDAGLNNPQGYQDASSQFKDADAWINQEQQAGNFPKDLSNVTFTGHSLGGGLAQYEAAKNDAYAVSFSGPSPWNMLKMKMANEKQL